MPDCFKYDAATLIVHHDRERDDLPAAFWLRETIDPLEARTLDLCHGWILNIAAGAGLHALDSPRRGLRVTAIDIAGDCVEIMRQRGVLNAKQADRFTYAGGTFDTIIARCNSLDIVGRFNDLPLSFSRMRRVASFNDSFDIHVGADVCRLATLVRRERAGCYFGELDLRCE